MPFKINPLKEFLVRPAVPPELARLPDLALNLMWSWQHSQRAVFRRLDPVAWKACNHNPVVLLGRTSQETMERAARDPRYLALYGRACESYDAYLRATTNPATPGNSMLVAYFSMEYGLLDCMPIYSGGLGVLSGDHLKASSDLSLPLVGIGLLYQRGYLSQSFDTEGWQQERAPVNDFYSLPIRPATRTDGSELVVDVLLGGATVHLKVWRIDVGRVKLYLLDSNIPQNPDPVHRDITGQLYAGGLHKRIGQEIVLGIGGLRALEELGLQPTVYHMNEGHSAFLAIERIRILMAEQGLSFAEAREASRTNNVFTTHTPVPAGIDLFDGGLMREYFDEYCRRAGIQMEDLLALGRHHPADQHEHFSMAVCAIRTSAACNAVSRLHREVSQKMWDGLWPDLPVWEVPITSVTNGVHLPTWINGDLAVLYDQYLEPDWREGSSPDSAKIWDHIDDIPAAELWEAHRRRKRRLITFVRERAIEAAKARHAPASEIAQLHDALDPEALTIGFARRFATYKRATLIFRDVERLKRILNSTSRPVQILIAGKAHPLDMPGKTLIREIIQHSANPEMRPRVMFVEDYGMQVARELVGGVDIWLNTPRRGEEACGTSGMKAGMNGILNLSIPDGWFDEAAESSGGWAIGGRDNYSPERDDSHAGALYSLLENEIVPEFYEGREHGMPVEWMRRVKQSLKYLSATFNCQRMISEYRDLLYDPAHREFEKLRAGNFEPARERVRWSARVAEAWPRLQFQYCGLASEGLPNGSPLPLRAEIDLAGLQPTDVKVEALVGHVGAESELEDVDVIPLVAREQRGPVWVFGESFVPRTTGRLGFAVRVSSNHFDRPLNRPCNALLKWADR
ncbi:MAG: alpha-glucan family phosphorylase [Acidobacteriota bacterium]